MLVLSWCSYAQLPLEGFEAPGTEFPPTGWARFQNEVGINTTWQKNPQNNSNRPAHTGTGAAFIDRQNISGTVNPIDYLATPAFNVPVNAQLRFWSRLTVAGDQGTLYRIMVKPVSAGEQNDPEGYQQIQQWTEFEINPINQEAYAQKTVTIPDTYLNQQVYLAFVIVNTNNGDRWLVDDVEVVTECLAPTNAEATNIGLTTATLTWDNAQGATAWDIEIKQQAEAFNGQNTILHTGDPSYLATLPLSDTAYKYRVRARCTESNISPWSATVNFSTSALGESCGAPIMVTLPYSVTGDTANYADNYEGTPGSTGCGLTSEWNTDYLGGNDVIYAYTATATGVISIDLTDTDSYAGIFVYDDCADIGVSCIAGGVIEYEIEPISLPTVPVTQGTTYYIVISSMQWQQTTPYNLVIQAVNCPKPTGLAAVNITSASAGLSWDANGASSWEVIVQAPGAGIPQGAGTTVTTNSNYTVTQTTAGVAFTPATNYEYYVRAACPDSDLFSAWAGPYAFMTTQIAADMPYTQDFETAPSGFSLVNGNQVNQWVIGTAANNGGANALYISNDNGVTNNYNGESGSVVHAFRDLQMPATVDQISVSFDWRAGGEGYEWGNSDYLRVWAVPASYVPAAGTAITEGDGRVQLGPDFLSNQTWQTHNAVLNAADYAGQVARIVFEWTNNNWTGNQPPAAIDNINIAIITCSAPSALTVSGIGQTNATVSWTAPVSGAASYDYYYSTTNVAPVAATVPSGNVAATTTPLTGLSISTQYFVWVRSNCDTNGNSFWVGPLVFTTTQIPVDLNYTEDFEGTHGWSLVNGTQTNKWIVGNAVNNGGTQSLYITNDDGVSNNYTAVSSTVHAYRDVQLTDNINELGIAFDWRSVGEAGWGTTDYDYMSVWLVPVTFTPSAGTVITPANSGGQQIGGNFRSNAEWQNYANSINVTDYQGEVRRVVFQWVNNDWTVNPTPAAVDNIVLSVVTCPRPTNLAAANITLTGATLTWTEAATAQEWQVAVLPYGSAAPANGSPEIITVTDETYTPVLTSSTTYVFYVRANCGDPDGISLWAGPYTFTTLVANDDCEDATVVPVNQGTQCLESVTGTLTGSTGSGVESECSWQMPESDVWYEFTATNTSHIISIDNQVGGSYYHTVYSGDNCGTLTQLPCEYSDSSIVTGLTVGESYKIMIFPSYINEGSVTSFEVCIRTPENAISATTTQYTVEELITDVLIGSDCAQITNITSSTGTTFGLTSNGIGYFDKEQSTFPMQNGIVLVSGDASNIQGPNSAPELINQYPNQWGGDTDLEQIVNIPPGTTNDATYISFDFVPFSTTLSFDFLFASEEYGNPFYECEYSDSFAFILTDLETNESTNLAVLPGTDEPIQVTNIHPDNTAQGATCPGINEQYFGEYSDAFLGSTKFNGRTVILTATAPVIVNHQYNIKLVIANEQDHNQNSAVFLAAGSFNIGEPDLGTDLLVADGNAVCAGGEITLETGSDPEVYTFEWALVTESGDDVIEGETGANLNVTAPGTYKVTATLIGTNCTAEAEIVVEYFPAVADDTGAPQALSACDADGFATFNLTQNETVILEGQTPGEYLVSFHLSNEDAVAGLDPITNPSEFENTIQGGQTIYVRIKRSDSECQAVKPFTLTVDDLTPQFDITPNLVICEGNTETIEITNANFNPDDASVTITWTGPSGPLTETGLQVTADAEGDYTVTINNGGCIESATVTVSYSETVTASILYDATEYCSDGVNGSVVITGAGNGSFTASPAGLIFTGTGNGGGIDVAGSAPGVYTITYSVGTAPCDATATATVEIIDTPDFTLNGDAVLCGTSGGQLEVTPNFIASAQGVSYSWAYTAADGTVSQLPDTTPVITTTQGGDYSVTVNNGGCINTASFTVTQVAVQSAALSYGSKVSFCQGDSDVLTPAGVNGGVLGTITASPSGLSIAADGSITIGTSAAGTYQVTNLVQSPQGCPSVTAVVTITIEALPSFSLGGPYSVCTADGATLTAGAAAGTDTTGWSYKWVYQGAVIGTTASIQSQGFGTYSLEVTTATGCSNTAQAEVTQNTEGFAVSFEEECAGPVFTLTALPVEGSFDPEAVSYAWTSDVAGFTGAATQSITPPAPGVYTLRVTTPGQCVSVQEFRVVSTYCNIQKGISPNGDGLNDSFDLRALDVSQLSIFNRYGAEVYSLRNYTNQWQGQGSNGDELPTGTYYYMVSRRNGEQLTGWIYINREE